MDIKKFINQKAEESMSQLKNEEFKKEILSDYDSRKKKKNMKWKFMALASCLVIIVVVSTLLAVFVPSQKEQIPSYSQGHELVKNVTLEDVEMAIGGINFLKDKADYCVMKYDNISGDTLAYVVAITDYGDSFYNNITFFISNNKYYNLGRPYEYDKFYEGNNFSMKYIESVTQDMDVYYYNCAGYIDLGNKRIYIEFEGANMNQESLFLDCLNSNLIIQ